MQLVRSAIIVLLGLCACSGQGVEDYEGNDQTVVSARKNQDVSILKQIHRHNEDGSYTYGYEGSDGSFKIETKTRTGEVTGKYGYVDDLGKLRVVEYGANKYGFQPSGEGITVPSPTLVELRENDEPETERPAKRPSPPAKSQKTAYRYTDNDGALQRQNDVAAVRPNVPARSPAADFDDGEDATGWAVRPEEPTYQRVPARSPSRPRAPITGPQRWAGARVAGSAGSAAARLNSPSPPVSGSFAPAPEDGGLSESYQSVQDYGTPEVGPVAPVAQHTYRTVEDYGEPETERPTFNRAAAAMKPNRRNDNGFASTKALQSGNYRTAPRQSRTGGVLDSLVEQYALPKSGSPLTHSVSFGLDS